MQELLRAEEHTSIRVNSSGAEVFAAGPAACLIPLKDTGIMLDCFTQGARLGLYQAPSFASGRTSCARATGARINVPSSMATDQPLAR